MPVLINKPTQEDLEEWEGFFKKSVDQENEIPLEERISRLEKLHFKLEAANIHAILWPKKQCEQFCKLVSKTNNTLADLKLEKNVRMKKND